MCPNVLPELAAPADALIADASALTSKFLRLTEEHHDLDYMIATLASVAGCDELLVARLKKRKLRLKDEIMRLADNLHRLGDATAHP
ncbi:MAG TPA: DUF465 domain-containing protein [Rhizomicrobium sp.]|jgi:hypothetical protein|nr:DUF465 domain-containing protein [Rhizomicrobium sp.]